ncbi:MAG: hypothetical protein GY696_15000 [Gammaproteobacteria bacterium]|nr:hypothetical protein [Gammaproteobacteria bacterium]
MTDHQVGALILGLISALSMVAVLVDKGAHPLFRFGDLGYVLGILTNILKHVMWYCRTVANPCLEDSAILKNEVLLLAALE